MLVETQSILIGATVTSVSYSFCLLAFEISVYVLFNVMKPMTPWFTYIWADTAVHQDAGAPRSLGAASAC